MVIPGPNVALIVANSAAYGARYGLLTVCGTFSGMAVQLGLVAFGMAEALRRVGFWLGWLRWVGAVYLIYLGVVLWRARPDDLALVGAGPKSGQALYCRALLISTTNPKTLLFYGAFLPQFVTRGGEAGPQMAILSGIFLAEALLIDSSWAMLAARARRLLTVHVRLRNRISGGVLIGAGTILALTRGNGL